MNQAFEKLSPDHFNVCLKIIEAKDLPNANISSSVTIQVGEEKKHTKVIRNTNKPYFEEYFTFEMYTNFFKLMNTVITISVFERRKKFRFKRLIGSISFDIGIVWAQKDHRLLDWLAITLPSDTSAQVKGFIRCDIKIDAPVTYKKLPDLDITDRIDFLAGKRVRYKIKLYKCVGLKFEEENKERPFIYVRTLFGRKIGSTSKRVLHDPVEWNEQIIFIEMIPPLFHRLTVEVVAGKTVLASKHFYLYEILKMLKGNYQNMFGPSYVHLYKNKFLYCGSLLMSIEIDSGASFKKSEILHGVKMLPTVPLSEEKHGYVESFLCYGVLFDAMLNDRQWRGEEIQLALNFGFVEESPSNESMNRPLTECFKAVPGNSQFVYLPIKDKKPSVFIRCKWPDCSHRLFNTNLLSNTAHYLRENTKRAQDLVTRGDYVQAKNILSSAVNGFKKDCKKISQSLSRGVTDLDHGRVQYLSNFININLPELASLCLKETTLELILERIKSLLDVLDTLCENIQESLPFVIVSLKKSQTIIGSSRLHPRQIVFSKKNNKKGFDCGKMISLFLETESNKIVGRLDIWLWLGFWDEVSHCLQDLPPGHHDLSKAISLPTTITYNTYKIYTVLCRIFSGCIVGGSTSEGLCDSSVRVLLLNQSKQTKRVKRSLAPLWKETLVLTDIQLYPSPTYIQENPPSLTVELWDHGTKPASLIGVDLVRPSYINHQIPSEIEFNLQWLKIGQQSQILCAFEIVQMDVHPDKPFSVHRLGGITPQVLDPVTIPFRLEVVFWGIRPNVIRGFKESISQVQAIIHCYTSELRSNIITRAITSHNFQHNLHTLQLELPKILLFSPPLILRVIANNLYVGYAVQQNVHRYEYKLPTKKEWKALNTQHESLVDLAEARRYSYQVSMPDLIPLMEIDSKGRKSADFDKKFRFIRILKILFRHLRAVFFKTHNRVSDLTGLIENIYEEEEEGEYDWWFQYFSGDIKIYFSELENQNEFNRFNDVLETFAIQKQKEGKYQDVMKMKAIMCLYQWPSQESVVTMDGQDPETGVLKVNELRERVKLLVRVYCVKAHNLRPSDPNGLADPYIEIVTPSNSITDKYNYIPKQLNPVFGRCLEITATLPTDSILTVRVMDWDMFTASDLIGETTIDIENRFYSKHRATCGLPSSYSKTGYNAWRDIEKPTEILEKLCNTHNLPLPQYYSKSVIIGSKEFVIGKMLKHKGDRREELALMVLNHWSEMPVVGRPLVSQHVETRPLFANDKHGIKQGKLEMWVDLFDQSLGEIPPPVDIKPREPQSYELRVVILNTSKVPLVDDSFFVGKKHTDIFVKGWLWDSNDYQTTDIHYTSLNGTGNFNWRFIFQFLYLQREKRIVFFKRDLFSIGKTENKVPPLLHLQVWDSDRISPDDFIGAMVLELCRMPRGSISVRTCKPKQYLNPSNTVDLFKVKHLRGWWPFFQMTTDTEPKGAGFLEAEFHLLTAEEALFNPAGLGRAAPNALPAPLRPELRIKFWLAPCRAVIYYVCGVHRGKVLMCSCVTASVLFIFVGIYSAPVFIIKKILGA